MPLDDLLLTEADRRVGVLAEFLGETLGGVARTTADVVFVGDVTEHAALGALAIEGRLIFLVVRDLVLGQP